MKDKIYLLVIIYWLILEYVLEGVFHYFSFYRFINIIENFLFALFVFYLISNIQNDVFKRLLYTSAVVLIGIMIWFETIMYLNFKIHFGPSSYFVFLNTNQDELLEFIREYYNVKALTVTFMFFIPLLRIKRIVKIISKFCSGYAFKRYKFLKIALFGFLVLIGMKIAKLIEHNLPYLIGRSVILNYKNNQYANDFNAQINSKDNFFNKINNDSKNTYIVVIGESVTSAHMQLYGYYRETSPLLAKVKDSLSVYNNVISPNTSTFYSLSKALTLGNYENPKKVLALPITTLFNKSGFKTFWISNHSMAFNPGSALARVSNEAQSKFFNSKEVVMNNLKHDGELLTKVDQALKDQANHKVIFLHLIGAHFTYKNRYPEEFDFFKDKPKTKFDNEFVFEKINNYDNAVRYSDFIVNQVLQKIKKVKNNSYLMYFSDHGEEVFQDDNFYGHLEDRPTKNTFTIPFIVWYSKSFKYPNDYFFDENRKYMTDDLWHSIAHISRLECPLVDNTRSIFSLNFKKRKRIILEDKEFETFFE
ncbi:phosphoethanolamine transferase [uncultured Algibacter sp.]|uniref:phosphoethanolamine transferase n=1 Tax=uncultured Algibacter sp. TaxID=298659 RepID=UPI0032173E54